MLTNLFIVLEYLVPSTGKLYHHKMRLRMLTGDSDVEEMLSYLEKRHPLYFVNRKLSKDQIRDLVKRLKFRVGEMAKKKAEANKKIEATAPKVLENKL